MTPFGLVQASTIKPGAYEGLVLHKKALTSPKGFLPNPGGLVKPGPGAPISDKQRSKIARHD